MPRAPRTAVAHAVLWALAASAGCFDQVGVTCPSLRPGCVEDPPDASVPQSAEVTHDLRVTVEELGARAADLRFAEATDGPPLHADLRTPPEDAARPDLSAEPPVADLALPPDLAPPPDLAAQRDLTASRDLATCSANNCPNGCCENNVCVAPTPLLCGIKGVVCVKCPQGQLCVVGICL